MKFNLIHLKPLLLQQRQGIQHRQQILTYFAPAICFLLITIVVSSGIDMRSNSKDLHVDPCGTPKVTVRSS